MMKRICILLLTLLSVMASLEAKAKVAPYYSLQMTEGASFPNITDWLFSSTLTGDMGVMVQPGSNHRFIGFYELRYQGPGLQREEGQQFTDRSMDHVFVFRHHMNLSEKSILKSQLDYVNEFTRAGVDEMWGTALYDNNRFGGSVTIERTLTPSMSLGLTGQLHTYDFPNYIDLLSQYQQMGSSTTDVTAGLQNQNVMQASLTYKFGKLRCSLDYTISDYTKQKVLGDTIQADGTLYRSTLQQDTALTFDVRFEHEFPRILRVTPSFSIKNKASNQNFWYYVYSSTTSQYMPTRFFTGFFDYQEMKISLPCDLLIAPTYEIFVTPEWNKKNYASRPPRDKSGAYLDGQQSIDQFCITYGMTFKPNKITRILLFYSYLTQTSNTQYEIGVPYNYSGNTIGVSFNYSY